MKLIKTSLNNVRKKWDFSYACVQNKNGIYKSTGHKWFYNSSYCITCFELSKTIRSIRILNTPRKTLTELAVLLPILSKYLQHNLLLRSH